jgi:hypothetical protein
VATPIPGAEAVAPAADGDAQPDEAALAACPTPPRQDQMTSLSLLSAARPATRVRGNSVLARPFQNSVNKPLVPAELNIEQPLRQSLREL